ncbi:MAG TPA: hypothetical protein VGD27_06820 [Longimicrobiales bacterium]
MERRTLPYLTIVLVVLASACSQQAEQRAQAAEAKLAQMTEISAAKDSLTRELMATTSFMTQLNDELAKVKPAKGSKTNVVDGETVVPLEQYRAGMITKIADLRTRLDENEKNLASTQARLRKLTAGNKEMTAQIAAYDSMVTGYKRVMDEQRTQIAVLTSNVQSLQLRVQLLNDENTNLTTKVADLSTMANTVYYVLGSKRELMEKGIVNEVGGSRVLGIGWRTGETLVPGPELSPEAFQKLSKTAETEIRLPDPTKKYRLVSRQNVNHLATKPDKDGKIQGESIKITNPDAFWANSKYLILVEG